MIIFYTQSHRRRPIRCGVLPALWDIQGAVPLGWCSRCGTEIYTSGRCLCDRCRKEKNYA